MKGWVERFILKLGKWAGNSVMCPDSPSLSPIRKLIVNWFYVVQSCPWWLEGVQSCPWWLNAFIEVREQLRTQPNFNPFRIAPHCKTEKAGVNWVYNLFQRRDWFLLQILVLYVIFYGWKNIDVHKERWKYWKRKRRLIFFKKHISAQVSNEIFCWISMAN